MRWSWSRKALETCPRRVVDRAKTLDGVTAGKEFSIWIDDLLKATEVLLRVVVCTLQILSRAQIHAGRICPPRQTRSSVQQHPHCIDL
jgi:hypothetical protein